MRFDIAEGRMIILINTKHERGRAETKTIDRSWTKNEECGSAVFMYILIWMSIGIAMWQFNSNTSRFVADRRVQCALCSTELFPSARHHWPQRMSRPLFRSPLNRVLEPKQRRSSLVSVKFDDDFGKNPKNSKKFSPVNSLQLIIDSVESYRLIDEQSVVCARCSKLRAVDMNTISMPWMSLMADVSK